MPRKYTKKKGGSAKPKRANAASSPGSGSGSGRSSRPERANATSPASSPTVSPRSSSSSKSNRRGSSSLPGSNSRLIRKKASKSPVRVETQPLTKLRQARAEAPVLTLKLKPKKSEAELALESRKDNIIEGLKHMTKEQADEIFSKVEIIPQLEVKIYDNTNIELFLIEKKKEL